MTLHITGMLWVRPTSDLEPVSGPVWQADHIEAITRVQEDGGFDRVLVSEGPRCPAALRAARAAADASVAG
jgi:alkanesulfonate monooxygenase SsuD/methylene tetrahydromethanopterin reductase-like flavin-dependent oxidoreductase (luciferase family)